MKITLKNIIEEEKVSSKGNKYTSCKLIVARKDGGKDTWITGFGSAITKTWKPGDTIDVDLEQSEQGYWSFKENSETKPSPDKHLELLTQINAKLDQLLASGSFSPKSTTETLLEGNSIPTEGDTGEVVLEDGSKIPF